jgi:hypothetical protein
MAYPPPDPPKPARIPAGPIPENPPPRVRRPRPQWVKPSTGRNSLDKIQVELQKLADDLAADLRPAAKDYAERCADLARRLREGLQTTGPGRLPRGDARNR